MSLRVIVKGCVKQPPPRQLATMADPASPNGERDGDRLVPETTEISHPLKLALLKLTELVAEVSTPLSNAPLMTCSTSVDVASAICPDPRTRSTARNICFIFSFLPFLLLLDLNSSVSYVVRRMKQDSCLL